MALFSPIEGRAVSASPDFWIKHLTEAEVCQRIVRLQAHDGFFPGPGILFDLAHGGQRWGARIQRQPRVCATAMDRTARDLPTEDLLVCAEVFAGLTWRAGAMLRFERGPEGLSVDGDLEP